jgi:hypothetical protein
MVVNPDLAIVKKRLYQDYKNECKILMVERPNLAKKLSVNPNPKPNPNPTFGGKTELGQEAIC